MVAAGAPAWAGSQDPKPAASAGDDAGQAVHGKGKKKRKPKGAPASSTEAPAPSVEPEASPADATPSLERAEATSPSPVSRSAEPPVAPEPMADVSPSAPAVAPSEHAAATKPEQMPASSPAAPAAAASAPAATLKIGGSAILWYYQPFNVEDAKTDVEIYDTRLTLEADWKQFGFFFEPHFRDSRLRSFYDGPVWVQQGYGYLDLDTAIIKVGKIYSHLGLFWDNSFYGNIEGYDGLKLAPEYGVSFEGTLGHDFGARYWAQFFPVDGRTNISLTDRDTVSVPGARRRNEGVMRFEPYAKLGENSELAAALSGEYFLADFGDDQEDVVRIGVDAKLTVGGLGVWGELVRQEGRSVRDFPFPAVPATPTTPEIPGRSSAHNDYLLTGAELTEGPWTARCNFSVGNYEDVSYAEWLLVPGFAYSVTDHMTVLGEFALWERVISGASSVFDRSFNLTLTAWF